MQTNLPLFVAGPLLRRTTKDEITLWAVTTRPLKATFSIYEKSKNEKIFSASLEAQKHISLGEHCFILMLYFKKKDAFPMDTLLEYDIEQSEGSLLSDFDTFLYHGETRPSFIISSRAQYLAHGSCRHPHQDCKDALVTLDDKFSTLSPHERADLLIMSGDQIYADDVCGPLLFAIRQVIDLLSLNEQTFNDASIKSCQDLNPNITPIYSRTKCLPTTCVNHSWLKRQLKSPPTPIFSSNTTENHLISFNEYFAMYVLVWSPALWSCIEVPDASYFSEFTIENAKKWNKEKKELTLFCRGLPNVRRLMAHIPTYMILDDHDITDDFNLTVGWERGVFDSIFAQNIITNGMLGYFFCQGWGNNPEVFENAFWAPIQTFIESPTPENIKPVSQLFQHFEKWHYSIPTIPKVVVIDTRTRRWRSEASENEPSGLMDWESLMDFQENIFNHDAVIVVSPAPMFGVKFIESLQRIVTLLGHPLSTDSENWMAHPGTANALLNIFKHPKTPKHFIILSGDVHYSFAYDIHLRFRKGTPKIWQITCSGFKNSFPEPYLSIFEACDRKLFGPSSPLNIFTRRKRMHIDRRKTDKYKEKRLINQSAIGELLLNLDGTPIHIGLLTAEGEQITFLDCDNMVTVHQEAIDN